ncbi:putative DNA-binding transcriptional regulator AlpA [Bradyrhizobium sp. USDA 4516]
MANTDMATEAKLLAFEAEDAAPRSARPRRMLSEEKVLEIVPFSRATLWRKIKGDKFPPPHHASAKRVFWYEDEIVKWQDALD